MILMEDYNTVTKFGLSSKSLPKTLAQALNCFTLKYSTHFFEPLVHWYLLILKICLDFVLCN